jgi:hypothetical protein
VLAQLPDDEHGGNHADGHEQPALPAAAARKKGEGSARVVRAHDVEEAGDGSPVPILVVAQNHLLGDLIHADDDKRPQQPGPDAAKACGGCLGVAHGSSLLGFLIAVSA